MERTPSQKQREEVSAERLFYLRFGRAGFQAFCLRITPPLTERLAKPAA